MDRSVAQNYKCKCPPSVAGLVIMLTRKLAPLIYTREDQLNLFYHVFHTSEECGIHLPYVALLFVAQSREYSWLCDTASLYAPYALQPLYTGVTGTSSSMGVL